MQSRISVQQDYLFVIAVKKKTKLFLLKAWGKLTVFLKLCDKQKVLLLMLSIYKTPSVHLPALVKLFVEQNFTDIKGCGSYGNTGPLLIWIFKQALDLPFLDQLYILLSEQIINEGKLLSIGFQPKKERQNQNRTTLQPLRMTSPNH